MWCRDIISISTTYRGISVLASQMPDCENHTWTLHVYLMALCYHCSYIGGVFTLFSIPASGLTVWSLIALTEILGVTSGMTFGALLAHMDGLMWAIWA